MTFKRLEYDGIDWNEGNTSKIKARVATEVIDEFFKLRLLIKEDVRHSMSEARFIAMGYTKERRCLFVAYTIRMKGDEKLIRPISARYMHKKEKEAYEAEVKKNQEK